MISLGVQLEQFHALQDVQNLINEYGENVTINFHTESTIARDEYNSIKKFSTSTVDPTILFKGFPVQFNPTQKQIEKAGIKEQCDCLVYLSTKDFLDRNIDVVKDLNLIKGQVIIRSETYNIKEKSLINQVGDKYTTITLSLTRR